MSDLLTIGVSGARAYQTALTTVSENIANSGNASYVKRNANIREIATSTGYSSTLNGMGAMVDGIGRAGNPYTETAVRNAGADLSKTTASTVWLERVESALSGGNLANQMTAFFASGTALQAEPTSTALRAGMLSAASSTADSFGMTARALDAAMTELDSRAVAATSDLSRLNQALLKVNQGLVKTTPGTSAAAGLADQRDTLLQQMSELTDVAVTMDQFGRATVRAGGSNGPVLVDTREAMQVGYQRTGGNVALTTRSEDGTLKVMTPDGGALSGMTEGAQRIAAARAELNDIAGDFTTAVNDLQRSGQDLNLATGTNMFATTADPSNFSVRLTDGKQIAAAKPGGGQRDSSNLAALATLRQGDGYEGRIQGLVTDNAATLKQRRLVGDAQTAIRDGAVTARSEMTGVNLDSEAIDLVRFQQAYQAASRVIQVARDTFQSILEIR